jgi:hypothetical protein
MPGSKKAFCLALIAGALSLVPPAPARAETGAGYAIPKAGFVMSADELHDLYTLVSLDDRTLLTLSRARNGRLILGRLTAQGAFDVLLRFDEDTSTLVRSPADVELGLHSIGPDGTARALLLYRLDTSSPYRVKKEVWLQALSLSHAGALQAAPPEKVAETAYETKGKDPKSPWWLNWPSPDDPAPATEVRLFVRDVNGDGTPDLVLWSKRCLSKPKSEPVDWNRRGEICPPGFRLDRWEAKTKLATKEGWATGTLQDAKSLAQPSPEQWQQGFGSAIFRSFE